MRGVRPNTLVALRIWRAIGRQLTGEQLERLLDVVNRKPQG